MKKLIAFLLAATMSFGAMTTMAFATTTTTNTPEESVSNETDSFEFNSQDASNAIQGSAETQFTVQVTTQSTGGDGTTNNINVTVPLKVTIVAPAAGGAIIAPAETAYQFVNNSMLPLEVKSIKLTDTNNDDLTLTDSEVKTDGTMKDTLQIKINETTLTPNSAVTPSPVIDIAPGTFASDAFTAVKTNIKVTGTSSMLSFFTQQDNAFQVMYTIGFNEDYTAPTQG